MSNGEGIHYPSHKLTENPYKAGAGCRLRFKYFQVFNSPARSMTQQVFNNLTYAQKVSSPLVSECEYITTVEATIWNPYPHPPDTDSDLLYLPPDVHAFV